MIAQVSSPQSTISGRTRIGVLYSGRFQEDYSSQEEGKKMTKTIQTLVVCLALSFFAAAQTKISGTVKCGNPDQFQKIDVGDKPGHALAVSQSKCTWTKPVDIAGAQTKDDLGPNPWTSTNLAARRMDTVSAP